MKNTLQNIQTGVLTLCAVVVTALVARHELAGAPPPRSERPEPRQVREWEGLAQGSVIGAADAPVQIVEFSDFQCPFCASIAPELRALVAAKPGQVAVWFRHMPLDKIHPHARAAALASACAEEQGRFAEFHDALFAQQDSIGIRSWEAFAREAAVGDLAAFRRCLDARRHEPRIESDLRAAKRLQVRATPTVIINGLLIEGALTREELEKHVADAAKRPRRRPTAARPTPTPEES